MTTIYSPIFDLFSVFFFIFQLFPSTDAIGIRGSPSIALSFQEATSSHGRPLHAHGPITLWCAPDAYQYRITTATFTRKASDGKRHSFNGTVSENRKNSTFLLKQPTILDAGLWECRVEVEGRQYGIFNTHLYARPILHTDTAEDFTQVENKDNHLKAKTKRVTVGSSVNISCPAIGHPSPTITWSKDKQPIDPRSVNINGNQLSIGNLTEKHLGVYSCQAQNEFLTSNIRHISSLFVERELEFESVLQCILPFVVIVVQFLILILIILICELRRKRAEKKLVECDELRGDD